MAGPAQPAGGAVRQGAGEAAPGSQVRGAGRRGRRRITRSVAARHRMTNSNSTAGGRALRLLCRRSEAARGGVRACANRRPAARAHALQVMISELVSDNKNGLRDEQGDTPAWVELFNSGSSPVSLQVGAAAARGGWGRSEYSLVPCGGVRAHLHVPAGWVLLTGAAACSLGTACSSDNTAAATLVCRDTG